MRVAELDTGAESRSASIHRATREQTDRQATRRFRAGEAFRCTRHRPQLKTLGSLGRAVRPDRQADRRDQAHSGNVGSNPEARIKPIRFGQYQANPEDFLRNAARLINEQKATVIIEHLTYNAIDEALRCRDLHPKRRSERTSARQFARTITSSTTSLPIQRLSGTFVELLDTARKSRSMPSFRRLLDTNSGR